MQEIIVYDANGDSISDLVQWDSNVYIYLSDAGITKAYQVHFFNNTMEEAYVVDSTYSGGKLKVKIPNALLIQPFIITGYVNVTNSDEQKCLYGFKINIRKKPKPSDFVDSKDYITFEEVISECREYAKNASDSANLSDKYAQTSKSYAVGGTSTRQNEEQDNSRYYCEQSRFNANSASQSADEAENSNRSAIVYAGSASDSAGQAGNYASQAKEYADQVANDKKEIDDTIKNSLLAGAEEILKSVEDYFHRAEELYRSCTIVCDGEIPARRVRTIIEIDCHTPERRSTGYYGVDFDGGIPSIRLLGE